MSIFEQWEKFKVDAVEIDAKARGKELVIRNSKDISKTAKVALLAQIERDRVAAVASLKNVAEISASYWAGDVEEDAQEAHKEVTAKRRNLLGSIPPTQAMMIKDAVLGADTERILNIWEGADGAERLVVRQYATERLKQIQPASGQVDRNYIQAVTAIEQPFEWEQDFSDIDTQRHFLENIPYGDLDIKAKAMEMSSKFGFQVDSSRPEPTEVPSPHVTMLNGQLSVMWDGEGPLRTVEPAE